MCRRRGIFSQAAPPVAYDWNPDTRQACAIAGERSSWLHPVVRRYLPPLPDLAPLGLVLGGGRRRAMTTAAMPEYTPPKTSANSTQTTSSSTPTHAEQYN